MKLLNGTGSHRNAGSFYRRLISLRIPRARRVLLDGYWPFILPFGLLKMIADATSHVTISTYLEVPSIKKLNNHCMVSQVQRDGIGIRKCLNGASPRCNIIDVHVSIDSAQIHFNLIYTTDIFIP